MPFKIIDCNEKIDSIEDYELRAVLRVDSMNRIPQSYKGCPISATYKEVSKEEAEEIREQLNKGSLVTIANVK